MPSGGGDLVGRHWKGKGSVFKVGGGQGSGGLCNMPPRLMEPLLCVCAQVEGGLRKGA